MGRRARPRALRLARRASLVVVDAPVPRPTSTPTPFPRPALSPRLAPRAAPQVDAAEDTYRRLNVRVKREVERGELRLSHHELQQCARLTAMLALRVKELRTGEDMGIGAEACREIRPFVEAFLLDVRAEFPFDVEPEARPRVAPRLAGPRAASARRAPILEDFVRRPLRRSRPMKRPRHRITNQSKQFPPHHPPIKLRRWARRRWRCRWRRSRCLRGGSTLEASTTARTGRIRSGLTPRRNRNNTRAATVTVMGTGATATTTTTRRGGGASTAGRPPRDSRPRARTTFAAAARCVATRDDHISRHVINY